MRTATPATPATPDTAGSPVTLDPPPDHRGPVSSVYVHAPFCARRCVYCDFAVHVRRPGRPGALESWIEALAGELDGLDVELADSLETLYVGGGTPSLLGADAMSALAELLGRRRMAGALEWTAEANPESFDAEVAGAWREAGANRVSLGIQSFQEPVLRWMGRLHGAEGAERAVRTARRAGFEEISVDLIFGLPERLDRDWGRDLDRAVSLGVGHVSLYGLTVEPDTPLGRAVAGGREEVADEARYREEYLLAAERLAAAGYVHYEVSNFALPGSESRHNRIYWSGHPYLGLGNAAHSYFHPVRRWNLREWDAYHQATLEGASPVADREVLDAAAQRLERVWLGLRSRRGLLLEEPDDRVRSLIRSWAGAGLAEVSGVDDVPEATVLRLTPSGWLLLDRLAVEMDEALPTSIPARYHGTQDA